MEGTELLKVLRKSTPTMIKIIITGYPSVQTAVEAVNENADAYILKPLKFDAVLTMIKEHLKKQKEATKYDEKQVTEFIKTRVNELESEKVISRGKSA